MERSKQVSIVESWMKDLSTALEFDLKLDAEGGCIFQIGDSTTLGIEISQDLPLLHFYSPLVALPVGEEIKFLLVKVLELNAFQILTKGGSIAIVPGGGPLVYCYSLPIEGNDSESFIKILSSFYETVPEIKQIISETLSDISLSTDEILQNQSKSSVMKKMMYIKC